MRYENPMTFRYAINVTCHIDAAMFFYDRSRPLNRQLTHPTESGSRRTPRQNCGSVQRAEICTHSLERGKKRREIDRIKYVNLGVSYGSRKLINKPVDL